jgi:protein-S-isoprenylcysteine O-methyltransferase Ste14
VDEVGYARVLVHAQQFFKVEQCRFMVLHTGAAVLLTGVAAVLVSVVVDGQESMPGGVRLLAGVVSIITIVAACRVFQAGLDKRRQDVGPRTRLVIADAAATPPANEPEEEASAGEMAD